VVAGLVVVAIGGSMVTPTSYYRLAPGSVRTTEDLIAVDGSVVYDDDLGVIGYTTIEMGPATVFEAFMGWIDPHTELLTREEALGDRDPDENRQINLQLMDSSKQLAAAVALSELGFAVDTSGTGAIVLEILPGSAADGVLAVGDTVVAVDDRPVTSNDELGEALAGSEPDDTVRLRVERPTDLTAPEGSTTVPAVTVPVDGESGRPVARPDGAPHATVEVFDLDVVLGAAEEDPTVPRLGVSTVTRDFQYLLPFDVTIDSGSVGGPSAGLAFTLGVIDVLTPGPLTGDKRVATTGTISFDGTVGPVGGVHQKTVAVRQAGADVFLVPPDEYAEASRWAGDDLEVIAVANVDEALAALDRVGGDTSGVRELQLANGPAERLGTIGR
jgi:PDZ domain-containing protein